MTRPFDVVGVGTNSVDTVLVLPADLRSVASSGKTRVAARHRFYGGQTATVLCACAALGLRTRYVGVFGSDENGRLMRRTLEERSVDLVHALTSEGRNRDAVILVDPDGRRTVIWDRPQDIDFPVQTLHNGFLDSHVMHVDDDDPKLALAAARLAAQEGVRVTSDLEHVTESTEELVRTVTYPIFEEHAPAKLTGEADHERALRKLRGVTSSVLCVTLGDRGSIALQGDRLHVAPAFRVPVADTTGAGDVFRAGFIYGVLMGWEIAEVLRFANAAAAVSCTRLGAIPSVPTLQEVRALLRGS